MQVVPAEPLGIYVKSLYISNSGLILRFIVFSS